MDIKGLLEYSPFKWTLLVGVGTAFICSAIILKTDVLPKNIYFCGTSNCFSNFVDLFGFPIEVLKATAAILAIVALLHKSEETQKQIALSESQNVYSNFFSHYEYVKKELSIFIDGSEAIKLKNYHLLYSKLFKHNSPTKFNHIGNVEPIRDSIEVLYILLLDNDPLAINNNRIQIKNLNLVEKMKLFNRVDRELFQSLSLIGLIPLFNDVEVNSDYITELHSQRRDFDLLEIDKNKITNINSLEVIESFEKFISIVCEVSFSTEKLDINRKSRRVNGVIYWPYTLHSLLRSIQHEKNILLDKFSSK
jgi:hypothetical protein